MPTEPFAITDARLLVHPGCFKIIKGADPRLTTLPPTLNTADELDWQMTQEEDTAQPTGQDASDDTDAEPGSRPKNHRKRSFNEKRSTSSAL